MHEFILYSTIVFIEGGGGGGGGGNGGGGELLV